MKNWRRNTEKIGAKRQPLELITRILTIVLIMCSAHCVYSQKGHGSVFFDSVVIYIPAYKEFDFKRIEYFKPYIDTINSLEKKLVDHYNNVPHKGDSTVISKWNNQLLKFNKSLEEYVEFVNVLSTKYFEENSLSLRLSLNKYLYEFCQKNNIDSKSIIIEDFRCTECKDYTKDFILFLKEEHP